MIVWKCGMKKINLEYMLYLHLLHIMLLKLKYAPLHLVMQLKASILLNNNMLFKI